jgi:prophage regulatory protein
VSERIISPLLRRPEVERRTGLSCTTIYRLMDEGAFPRPLRIGVRAVAWPEHEIDAWQASRPLSHH